MDYRSKFKNIVKGSRKIISKNHVHNFLKIWPDRFFLKIPDTSLYYKICFSTIKKGAHLIFKLITELSASR